MKWTVNKWQTTTITANEVGLLNLIWGFNSEKRLETAAVYIASSSYVSAETLCSGLIYWIIYNWI